MTGTRRALAVAGALCCGAAVALAAVSMHGLDGRAATQGAVAAAFAFGHGLALLLLAPTASTRLRQGALLAIATGLVLFAGSLAAAAFLATPTGAAPAGGLLLMAGWLLVAVDAVRA